MTPSGAGNGDTLDLSRTGGSPTTDRDRMNITKTEGKVIMEMTTEESMELRNAFRHAMNYWQYETQKVESKQAQEVMANIARAYGKTHNAIADVIGY